MKNSIQEIIQNVSQQYADERLHHFYIEIQSIQGENLSLGGRVLEQNNLDALSEMIHEQHPGLVINFGAVEVLRKPSNPILKVGTNITSVHTNTSFISEMSSQMLHGEAVEILMEQGKWVYTRQMDGYLSWTYRAYLTGDALSEPTHIIIAPTVELKLNASAEAELITRVYSGTRVKVLSTSEEWAYIRANAEGWVPMKNLRSLGDFPQSSEARREQMIADARSMIGVPYLWGGASSNGIDCSGFARLIHRLSGIEIPRDADMQSAQSKPVGQPYQPGDLIFFGEGDSNRRVTHVGISMGGWKIIHSSRSRNGVYLDDIQEKESLRSIFMHAGSYL